ncbi:hypothetical protein GCM10023320_17740 [Pseudonocardia adelaidensis]|uniref:Uncharacterized protein n=1 Tax=Pseudonocardia adelaidensis TaxID=648754 RepID=A0ABP9NEM9_9PSEU
MSTTSPVDPQKVSPVRFTTRQRGEAASAPRVASRSTSALETSTSPRGEQHQHPPPRLARLDPQQVPALSDLCPLGGSDLLGSVGHPVPLSEWDPAGRGEPARVPACTQANRLASGSHPDGSILDPPRRAGDHAPAGRG